MKLFRSIKKFARVSLTPVLVASSAAVMPAISAGALSSTPEMVKDIGTGNNSSDDLVNSLGGISEIFIDGEIAYFAARSIHNGTPDGDGLWKSDGTELGTIQITSATELGGSGIDNFVKFGGAIYFTVIGSGGTGTLIKKYDGTSTTTVVSRANIKTAVAGSANADDYVITPQSLWTAGGKLYFTATVDPISPTWDIFSYDGTGVARATQIAASSASDIGPVFEMSGITYFFSYKANDAATYAFDTIPSSNRRTTVDGDVYYYSPQQDRITILPGSPTRAYMLMNTGRVDPQSSVPDGDLRVVSFNGTTVTSVKNGNDQIRYAGYPTTVGNRVYFPGADNNGDFLWYTSDTSATKIPFVHDVQNPAWNIPSYEPKVFGSLNDSTYIFLQRGVTNLELWRSDGTATGTQRLADLEISSSSSATEYSWLYAAQGELFFVSKSGSTNILRKTDGTVGGTSGALSSVAFYRYLTLGTNVLFFYGQTYENNASLGVELHGLIPSSATPPNNSGSNNGSSNTPSDSNSSGSGSSNTNTNTSSGASQSTTTTLTDAQIAAFKAATLVQGSQVIAGQTYTVSADGFSASETVNGYLKGTSSSVGSASANSVGKASVSIKIPSNVSGKKTLYLHGARSGHGVRQTITINKAATVLPATGSNVQMVWMAVLTLAAGIGVTGAARRKRTY